MSKDYLQQNMRTNGPFEKHLFDYPDKLSLSIHWSTSNSNVLIIIRVIAFILISVRFVLQLTEYYTSLFHIFQFLTQFGFNLTLIYFALVCLDYFINHIKHHKVSANLSLWINLLYQIVLCLQFIITIIFWTILFDYSSHYTAQAMIKEIGIHGFPLICLLADFIFNVYQFPKRHLIAVILVGLLYLFINLSYSLITNPIYDPIDWISVMSYVYILVCLVILLAVHTLSRWFWTKYKKDKIKELINKFQLSYLYVKQSGHQKVKYEYSFKTILFYEIQFLFILIFL